MPLSMPMTPVNCNNQCAATSLPIGHDHPTAQNHLGNGKRISIFKKITKAPPPSNLDSSSATESSGVSSGQPQATPGIVLFRKRTDDSRTNCPPLQVFAENARSSIPGSDIQQAEGTINTGQNNNDTTIQHQTDYDVSHDPLSPTADPDQSLPYNMKRPPECRDDSHLALCDTCGDELNDVDDIDAHLLLHYKELESSNDDMPHHEQGPLDVSPSPPADPTLPYVCEVCQAGYKTKRGLDNHMDRLGHNPPVDEFVPKIVGIPSGTPTTSLLNLLVSTFRLLAKQYPPVELTSRLLSICRKMIGSGRLPPANMLLKRGLLGRAWEAMQAEASPQSHIPEPIGDERKQIINELHPLPPKLSLPPSESIVGPVPKITGQALLRELKAMKAVSAGPSGLGKQHLLYLCEKAEASDILADALRQCYTSKCWDKLKSLAKFRLKLIPKPNGKWRPIAVQETLLVAFHRIILKQTPSMRKLPDWQLAFTPMAHVKAINKAELLKREHHLLSVDVKNAFNSVPHSVILFALNKAKVPHGTVSYIESFLAARFSDDLPAVPAGVPQGDPLSMAMFCLSIIWPVESMLQQYKVIAYADDMILASNPSIPADKIREDAHKALAAVGLTVTLEKCASTQDGGISFMGTRIIRDSPYNLAEHATRTLHDSLNTLRASNISQHDKLRVLSYCIVPSVNYGPLVDAYPGPQSYREVDLLVITEIAKLLRISDKNATDLALTPRSAYGLSLVLPHHYHADMQEQARIMRAGTFRTLRKNRLERAKPLRTFLTLALSRGPPLSDDQLYFIGDCLSGKYQRTPPMGICSHCKQPMLHRHHLVCKSINGYHVSRHTMILEALLKTARGKTSRIMKNSALPINHLKPDLIIEDGFGDLVITVPWRIETSYSLKMTKYIPLIQQGKAAFFLPIVVGGDGTMHPSSAAGLARAGVDLYRFKQEVSQILMWHYTQTAIAYANLPPEPVEEPHDLNLALLESTQKGPPVCNGQPPKLSTSYVPTPGLYSMSSPSVEMLEVSSTIPKHTHTHHAEVSSHPQRRTNIFRDDTPPPFQSDDNDDDPFSFQRSRAPSPLPCTPPPQSDQSTRQELEPTCKTLPSFFKTNRRNSLPATEPRYTLFKKRNPQVETSTQSLPNPK